MWKGRSGSRCLAALLLLGMGAVKAQATVVLDWSAHLNDAWTAANSYSRTYALSSGLGNVTIALTGATSQFTTGYPIVDQFGSGGFTSPTDAGFDIDMDLTSRSNSVTVTYTFDRPGGVSNVGFWIADVDRSGSSWQDRLTFSAALAAGGSVTPNLTPRVSANYSISGGTITATNATSVASNSSNGNVFVYIPGAISSFTMVYDNGTSAGTNPTEQYITLHSLAVLPEPSTVALTLLGLGALALRGRRLRLR